MKYVVVLCDGMSDHPQEALGGRTPMQAAAKPHMDGLASRGEQGLANTGVPELPMGSDVGNLAVLGYDPRRYYSGRAPLEALNLGVKLGKGEVAFRCNFVHVKDGLMEDYSAGHLSTEDAKPLIRMLNERLGSDKARFHLGTQYRHLLVLKGAGFEGAKCTPPHDISGQPIQPHLPKGSKGSDLARLMQDSALLLEGHEVNRDRRREGRKTANMIWLWGQGKGMELPAFKDRHGMEGTVISAVDLIKGLGRATGLDVVEVPGATGWIDSNFAGKAEAGLKALKKRDFLFVHLEATDEAGHKGEPLTKVKAIELIDDQVVGALLKGLEGQEFRLMVIPDHPTPCELKTHALEPVPYLIFDSTAPREGGAPFDEASAAKTGVFEKEGWSLMDRFLRA